MLRVCHQPFESSLDAARLQDWNVNLQFLGQSCVPKRHFHFQSISGIGLCVCVCVFVITGNKYKGKDNDKDNDKDKDTEKSA